MKRALKVSIDIKAAPETVWQVLLDFYSYPEWSEFLVNVEGLPVTGSRLRVTLASAGGKVHSIRPVVLQVAPPRTFRWVEHLGVPGLLDGEHGFFLEYLFGGRTRFRQTETLDGFLTPLLWWRLESPMADGFAAFNRALKKRAESRS